MARPLRVEFEGALYHVTSRGNAREAVFEGDADRTRFLKILADTIERFGWICHAYCLMTNHYHLLIETPDANLSRGMQLLNGVYTQWYNREHQRVGHLFQGRFKAILVEKESYLLELARYIVLNPIRAAISTRINDWPWSSYRATAGQAEIPAFLEVDWLLSQFDSNMARALHAYRDFVDQGRGARVWEELQGGCLIGGDSFVNGIRPMLDAIRADPEYRRRELLVARPSLDGLFHNVEDKKTRNERIYEAVRIHRYTLRQVGDHVGLLYSTISMIAKREHEKS